MEKVEKGIGVNKRWEKGIPHYARSEDIYSFIEFYDFNFGNDFFCFKSGGDGDNGEHLMYLLDEYFAQKDNKYKEKD